MMRKVLFTFSSKLFITAFNFLIILITARYLGAEGRGIISLLILGITINQLISNLFGGAALSYLTPRTEIYRLVTPAFCWAVFSTLIVSAILIYINLVPVVYAKHLFFLSLLQAIYSIHLNVLLGKGHIREQNLVNTSQASILFLVLLFMLFVLNIKTVESYIISFYFSLIFSFLLSLYFLRDEVRLFPLSEWMSLWKTILKNGYVIQLASIAQLLNYRLSYYLIDHFYVIGDEGKKLVGVYATTIAIAEAIWLVGKSMGLIQYTNIVKAADGPDARNHTVRYGKISFLVTLVMLLFLIAFPASFYGFVFGQEFRSIPLILGYLLPGILSFGMALMYSNYFAGIGLNKINLWGSFCGLIITLGFGLWLVPALGMKGAAITASLSYFTTSILLLLLFCRHSGIKIQNMIPGVKDILIFTAELKMSLKK